MHQGEAIVPSNLNLRIPKKEEDVPTQENVGDEIDIMDKLEVILDIGDEEKLEENMFRNVGRDFMVFGEFSKELEEREGEEEETKMKMEESLEDYCENDVTAAMERENLWFWEEEEKKPISLNLNYQEVLDAWSDGRSPWADGYSLSTANDVFVGEVPVMEEEKIRREARVLRYKEKRQSRLFAKKIRYQVRKLNAEKRPRLKGRFVKRIPADKILR